MNLTRQISFLICTVCVCFHLVGCSEINPPAVEPPTNVNNVNNEQTPNSLLTSMAESSSTYQPEETEETPEHHQQTLSFDYIRSLYEGTAGSLSYVEIMKSRIRDGYYVIVDYSAIQRDLYYFDDINGYTRLGIGGHRGLFSIREVSLTQGEFIEVYAAAHNGTGRMYLYENNESVRLAYTIQGSIIDTNLNSWRQEEAVYFVSEELVAELTDGKRISWIYANGRLNSEYSDFNSDGHTDIRFYGIRQTTITSEGDHDDIRVVLEEAYMMLYLFDPEGDVFYLDQEYSFPIGSEQYSKWLQVWP